MVCPYIDRRCGTHAQCIRCEGGERMTDLAKACIEYRLKHNMTQAQFAEMCGLNNNTISRIESGGGCRGTTEVLIRKKIESE